MDAVGALNRLVGAGDLHSAMVVGWREILGKAVGVEVGGMKIVGKADGDVGIDVGIDVGAVGLEEGIDVG